jgi:hypothetical protein
LSLAAGSTFVAFGADQCLSARIDKSDRKPIATVEATLSATAETLSRRMGGGALRRSN